MIVLVGFRFSRLPPGNRPISYLLVGRLGGGSGVCDILAYLGPFLALFRPFFPAIFGFYVVPDGPGSTPDQYEKNHFLTFFIILAFWL